MSTWTSSDRGPINDNFSVVLQLCAKADYFRFKIELFLLAIFIISTFNIPIPIRVNSSGPENLSESQRVAADL